MNKSYQLVRACPLLRTPTQKNNLPLPTCLTQSHVKSRRTPLFLSKPLLKCCPLITKIRHPSILWDLLNSCRNRCSTTVFLTSNNSVNFTAAMSVLRENQITSPEIVHSAIFCFSFFIKTMLILIYKIFSIKKVTCVDICSALFVQSIKNQMEL